MLWLIKLSFALQIWSLYAEKEGKKVCYSPYYRHRTIEKLNSTDNDRTAPLSTTHTYWQPNPSAYWSNPPIQLIRMSDFESCRKAFNWKGLDKFPWHFAEQLNLVGLSPRCYKFWRYLPSLHQYMSLYGAGVSNFGQDVYSTFLMFSGQDRTFLDFVLVAFPAKIKIVEFGTASGITSVYLGISAKMRDGDLKTFDITDNRVSQAKAVWNDSYMIRIYEDILEAAAVCYPFNCTAVNKATIAAVSQADIWLIDNGIKDKETFLYAKFLPIGSIALVHDMTMSEEQYFIFNQVFLYWGYEGVFKDFAESMGTHLRAWQRVSKKSKTSLVEPSVFHPAHSGMS